MPSQMVVVAGEGGADLLFVSSIDVLGSVRSTEERQVNRME